MSYINGIYSVSLGPCDDDVDLKDILEPKKEEPVVISSIGHKTKHARDLIPSINQQVKIGNLLSTLRPNQ